MTLLNLHFRSRSSMNTHMHALTSPYSHIGSHFWVAFCAAFLSLSIRIQLIMQIVVRVDFSADFLSPVWNRKRAKIRGK